jgi:small subunit ribosomal protein S3Ae
VETKDGYVVRVKPMSIADKRIQSSQEAAMRAIMEDTLKSMGSEQTISELVKSVISGDMAKEISRACRIIIPVKRIEIRKAEILSFGEGVPEPIEEPQPEAPEAEEEPEESEAEEPAEETSEEEEQ